MPFINFSQVQIGQDIDGKYGGYQFGNSVSSSSNGDIVAVGSPFRGGVGAASSGQVRIYENISGVWTQIGQDINGEAAYDESGTSVSISSDGSIVAVGAPRNDDNGEDSGQVRIYENISGVWTQIGEDIDGEATGDRSGRSISLSSDGNIVAINAPGNDDNGEDSGHVRIYENISGVWTQIGEDIDGEDSEDTYFGGTTDLSLSNDGNIVAIGAPGNDGNGNLSGHVRVYENISGVWTQVGQDIDGETFNNLSGFSVSISGNGNILAIGAPYNNGSGFESYIGQVRIYENISGIWTQIGQDIYGNNSLDWNGFSLDLSNDGSIVAIGAPYFNNSGGSAGFVHIYENISGVWTQVGQNIDGEDLYDRCGRSVSLSNDGNKVVIGSPNRTNSSGEVRIYENISGTWTQVGQDINGDITTSERFGSSVSLSANGNILASGTPYNDDNGENTGQVRVYENISGVWTQFGQNISGGDELNVYGGASLSDDGTILAINKSENNSNQVRVYENLNGTWVQIGQDILKDGNMELSGNGNFILIGETNNNGSIGQLLIYENISGVWTQVGSNINGDASIVRLGSRISINHHGNVVAASAIINDGYLYGGRIVRVFENISGIWTQIGQDITNEADFDDFGRSLSLSNDGSILAIGAPGNDGNGNASGHVRVYENTSGIWTQIGSDIDGEYEGDASGGSVSLSGDGSIIAIGSKYNDDNGENSGQVRLYKNISGEWTQIGVDINGEGVEDYSGSISLSADGTVIAIGAVGNDENGLDSGHIRVYDLSAELSVESFQNDFFNVFVNENTEKIEIKLYENQILNRVNLYTIDGKYLYSEKSLELNTNSLSRGIYVIEIETNKGKSAKKIIIK